MPGEHVLWRDVADGAVQAHIVVMLYVTLNQTSRIPSDSGVPVDAFPFECCANVRFCRSIEGNTAKS